ncbi:MAG: RsmE family RNA methyltransferase [Rickettsiales bacterium]
MIRLYLEDFAANSEISLSHEQAHYVTTVMRKKAGDFVALFNNKQGEWVSEITSADKKKCFLQLLRQSKKPVVTNKLGLVFAPAKANYPTVIQKATELGITDIYPIITERSVVKDFNFERMYKIAIEAAEQSERINIPTLHEFRKLESLEFANFSAIYLGDESRDCKPMPAVLKEFKAGNDALIIGAEGGFTAGEFAFMKKHKNCHCVKLGDNILKADTAAIAAISIYKVVYCD